MTVTLAGTGPTVTTVSQSGTFPTPVFSTSRTLPAVDVTGTGNFFSPVVYTPHDSQFLVFASQVEPSFTGTPGLTVNLYGGFSNQESYATAPQNFIQAATLTIASNSVEAITAPITLLFPQWQIEVVATGGTGLVDYFLYFL